MSVDFCLYNLNYFICYWNTRMKSFVIKLMVFVSISTSLFSLSHWDCCKVMCFGTWYNWVTCILIIILKTFLLSKMISIWQLVILMLLPLKTTSSTTTFLKKKKFHCVPVKTTVQSPVFIHRLHCIFSIQGIDLYLTFTFFEEASHWWVQKCFSSLCSLSCSLLFCYIVCICLLIKLWEKAFRKTLRTPYNFVLQQL